MQSAEDRAVKYMPCPLYGARLGLRHEGSNFTGRPRPIMPLLYDLLAMANERFVIGIFMKRSTSQLVSIAVHCVTP